MSRRTFWWSYCAFAVIAVAAALAWIFWRESTCVACSVAVRLDRPGVYRVVSRSFANEKYHASFLMGGVVPRTFDWYENAEENLWAGSPPEVEITMTSPNEPLFQERSAIAERDRWVFSGSVFDVDVYKFLEFRGAHLREYHVQLRVIRGSPAATRYQPTFRMVRTCEYEGLAHLILLVVVIASLLSGVATLGLAQFLVARNRRSNST
jgi:hypothetical protein